MSTINSLIRPLEDMTDEELKAYLLEVRHRREVERPAAKARAKKERAKVVKKQTAGVEKLLDKLNPEDLEALLKELAK